MDRLLNDLSVDRSGSVARAIKDASISGVDLSGEIQSNAPHWAIEPFVPVHVQPLIDCLLGRDELAEQREAQFRQFCDNVHSIQQEQTGSYHRRFAAAYSTIDPDSDCRDPLPNRPTTGLGGAEHSGAAKVMRAAEVANELRSPEPDPSSVDPIADSNRADAPPPEPAKLDQAAADTVIEMCDQILGLAGYTKLGRSDIEQCAETVSQFGVPLHVNFDLYDQLIVYSRGDIIGTRIRRRLRNLFRPESVNVPIYQRMVVILQLAEDAPSEEGLSSSALHLRMFKNIPKLDIDMLLPGTRVRIGGFDRAKFILPSLGGFLVAVRRVAQYTVFVAAFVSIAVSKSIILIGLVVALLIRSVFTTVFGYFRTKKHYQLNLTRNLYFQKLDCNAGVVYRIIQQAERQAIVEDLIAYYGILIDEQPISERRLRRRCERLVRETIDVEVDFQVANAIERLSAANYIVETDHGWSTTATDR